jgi:hypothetical protein
MNFYKQISFNQVFMPKRDVIECTSAIFAFFFCGNTERPLIGDRNDPLGLSGLKQQRYSRFKNGRCGEKNSLAWRLYFYWCTPSLKRMVFNKEWCEIGLN